MRDFVGPPGAARIAIWPIFLLVVVFFVACSGGGSGRSAGDSPAADGETPSDAASADATPARNWAGKNAAPEFPAGLTWFNVERPLTLAGLTGKVVVLDFWTQGCINCQHIIPDLKRLEAEFGDHLVVIGVHSGKYATEHEDESVVEAARRFGLEHAVVNDPDFEFWGRYGARAWPTVVVIDPAGKLVGQHSGEGVYPLLQPILASLLEREFVGRLSDASIGLALDRTTVATVLSYPGKVLADEKGQTLYIADSGHNRILVASLSGELRRAIGTGEEGFADGGANEATFRQPQGLALSGDGKTLYVADTRNHAVRAVDVASGEVTTIAGTGKQLDRLPQGVTEARKTAMASPWDVAVSGNRVFVTMAGVHQVWSIDLDQGTVTVFAGTSREGIENGDRLKSATLAQPSGIGVLGGALYWVDPESSAVRSVDLDGTADVRTLVGTGLFDYGDEDGKGKEAKLQHAQGLAIAGELLLVADTYNHKVKSVTTGTAQVTTLAGSERGYGDGAGGEAKFDEPGGLGYAAGVVYVADTNNHLVRTVELRTGLVRTLALSNLSVLSAGPARVLKVTLAGARVAPGATNLLLTVKAPAGHHLNSLAPGRLALLAGSAATLELGESIVTWSSDAGEVTVPVPLVAKTGTTTLTAVGDVYYCRTGEEALCFIQRVEISLEVEVAAGADGALKVTYELPAGGP